ncbi:putative glucose-methanol-choline oxidoreductase protein [Botrytis fragariae]|uniref:Putative glucose-methanol-choline oxidoreductase protein n=1 Tax=Botrytis fragariae TaxID=1964551 RepID=A0A8H6AU68_9HELO|nr:putative glucose-methanol-choline oxidoreductase protein [Botrytis fragariae]KAF5873729.1 putative glucose-methanol-choline oxidoreductase protein [Botrytis fragariae]
MSTEPYDIIVIGGGTSGLVLANRLSEDPNLRIIVLESGEDRSADPNTLTPDNWTFQTVPQKEVLRDIIKNGKFLGIEGWDYAAYEKALKKSYTLHKPSGVTEGNGPLQITLASSETLWQKAWIEGLESVGFPRTDPLSGHLGGPNIAPESIDPRTKQRSYAGNAYLDPIRGRPNLTIQTNTTITKVLLEKSSSASDAIATGVEFASKDDSSQTITARKEVIICAGAINSPRILELSGIGDADLLQRLGINVVIDNPHVGENLQNHLFTGLTFEARDDVETVDAIFRQQPDAVAAAMQEYATKGTGYLSTSNITTMAQLPLPEFHTEARRKELDQLLAASKSNSDAWRSSPTTPAFATAHESFVRSIITNPSEALGNYVFGSGYAPFDAPSPSYRAPGKHISIAIELSHPLSRGSVHITSSLSENTGTNTSVAINSCYLTHPLDIEILSRQLRFTEDIISRAEPLTRHLKPFSKRFADLDIAKEYVRRTVDGAYHYTGTCAMMSREMGGRSG